jgi:vacuolar-type H+-ATPase subunit H
LSKEAIKRIQDTEDQAAILCRVAEEKAAELKERIRTEGEAHCIEAEQEAETEYAAQLEDIRRRALALEIKKRKEAEAEAEEMTARARERIDEAVKMIVWEIVERCQ